MKPEFDLIPGLAFGFVVDRTETHISIGFAILCFVFAIKINRTR